MLPPSAQPLPWWRQYLSAETAEERRKLLKAAVAQSMPKNYWGASRLVDAGIQAIWNFSITQLVLPPPIIVECSDLSSSLAALTSRLRASRSS